MESDIRKVEVLVLITHDISTLVSEECTQKPGE